MPMKLSGRRGLRGELRDGNRRGVAGQNHAGAEDRIGILQHAHFQIELLGNRFDDEIGGGERLRVGDGADARQRRGFFCFADFVLLHFAVEIFGDGVEAAIEEALLDVAEDHVVAGSAQTRARCRCPWCPRQEPRPF